MYTCLVQSLGTVVIYNIHIYIYMTTDMIYIYIQPKDLDRSHFSVLMVADINITEVTKKHAVPLSKVSNGD